MNGGQALRRYLDYCDIRIRVATNHLGLNRSTIMQPNGNLIGIANHMLVRHHVTGSRIDNHTRTKAAGLTFTRLRFRRTEKTAEKWVLHERVLTH